MAPVCGGGSTTGGQRRLSTCTGQGEGEPAPVVTVIASGDLAVVRRRSVAARVSRTAVALGEPVREAEQLDVDRLAHVGGRDADRRDQPVDQRRVPSGATS